MDISIPYYEDLTRISNSNIGWFLKKGPRYLKEMLDGKEGLKASFLDKGTMIHEYILQPEEFWKDYIILDFAVPKVKQQKDLLEFYSTARLVDPFASEDNILLKSYEAAYNNNKSKEKKIQEAKELVELYQNYIEYFRNKDSKKVISFADFNMLKAIKKNMEDHKKANELLFKYPETFEVHNEFHINWEYPNASTLGDLPCKSLLDRVMIDHTNKKIILVDIKTTADIYNFKHSIEEFDYCRQLAYYWLAIHWYFKNELKLNIEEYEYETYIIAVQSHDGYEVRVFKFNPKTIEERLVTIDYAIKRIAWHKNNDLWDHMKEYYDEDGAEMIC
jgi:hypothetical protein